MAEEVSPNCSPRVPGVPELPGAGQRAWPCVNPCPPVTALLPSRAPRARGAACAGTARTRCGARTAPPPSTGAATSPGPSRGQGECDDGWGAGPGRDTAGRGAPDTLVRCAQGRPALPILLRGRSPGPRGGGDCPEPRPRFARACQGQCYPGRPRPRGTGVGLGWPGHLQELPRCPLPGCAQWTPRWLFPHRTVVQTGPFGVT